MTKADFQEHLSALAAEFASLYGSSNETSSEAETTLQKGDALAESLACLIAEGAESSPQNSLLDTALILLAEHCGCAPDLEKYGLFIKKLTDEKFISKRQERLFDENTCRRQG